MDNAEALRALEYVQRYFDKQAFDYMDEQLEIIRAHLTDPGYVRVPVEASACHECGGDDLEWTCVIRNDSPVQSGRLMTCDVSAIFVLGCNSCSETVRIISGDDFAEMLDTAPKETSHD